MTMGVSSSVARPASPISRNSIPFEQAYHFAMPRALPSTDFRSRRRKLLPSDFVFSTRREERPSDLIKRGIWNTIFVLPDDVAIRTTNHHGTAIRDLHELAGVWLAHAERRDLFTTVLIDANDDFHASLYTAITGFYRISITASRAALELLTIGTWAQISRNRQAFREWQSGNRTLSFGMACDGLISGAASLQSHLTSTVREGLFNQKTNTSQPGYARKLFDHVSEFTHARPGYTDSALRQSNGPIYVREAFEHALWIQSEVFALSFIYMLLARPRTVFPPNVRKLFADPKRVKSKVLRAAFEYLHT